jgi:O6-methylguanine-DNA--protein-cysteine methyltransferase
VPYHRVIRADGSIGEYGPDGIGLKRRLLAHEGVELE